MTKTWVTTSEAAKLFGVSEGWLRKILRWRGKSRQDNPDWRKGRGDKTERYLYDLSFVLKTLRGKGYGWRFVVRKKMSMASSLKEARKRCDLQRLLLRSHVFKNPPESEYAATARMGDLRRPVVDCPFCCKEKVFRLFQEKGRWYWRCAARCGGGDEVSFIAKARNVSKAEAALEYFKWTEVPYREAIIKNPKALRAECLEKAKHQLKGRPWEEIADRAAELHADKYYELMRDDPNFRVEGAPEPGRLKQSVSSPRQVLRKKRNERYREKGRSKKRCPAQKAPSTGQSESPWEDLA